MPVEVCSIASGSNGNCYYIGNENEAVLVDAGLSCKELERRMRRAGLLLPKVKAVFVTHEHADHISGLAQLAKKHQVPVFLTQQTHRGSRLWLDKPLINYMNIGEDVMIGDLVIHPFAKCHDAAEPCSITVACRGVKVGVITDIGYACDNVVRQFSECQAVFLESNYDEQMLDKGRYPFYLKNRIRGGQGHLSNRQALELFQKHRSPSLTHLFLSHLSYNNNCPKLVEDLFRSHADGVQTVVASRVQESAVYNLAALSRLLPNHFDKLVRPQPQLRFSF